MLIPRIIKKYPNRRLYDTGVRRYIDLADIRTLVAGRTEFIVIDKKSGQDITRNILLQVIAGVELASSAIMSSSFLVNLIRAHGTDQHAGVAIALEETVKRFD
jgi:polyhydroxyalkanoate synthesis repressor PhaR